MLAEEISSTQNPRIRHLLALQQKSALRRQEGLFVVEGRRELEHCLQAGMQPVSLYCLAPEQVGQVPCDIVKVTPHVYERIAYRGSTEGIVAVIRTPQPRTLPGNLGAVLRSADAAQATGVIVCDPLTDLYNPNLIRSSIGAVFTVPVVTCSSAECIAFFRQHGIQILTAQLQDSHLYYDTPMTGPTAIVMGTESTGLTPVWRQAADAHIRIPMLGRLDSLNVSVSAAILLFEAVRQRQVQHTNT